jgi:RHS repeat-associated protein
MYYYDAHGNMIKMPHLQEIKWDWKDQMKEVTLNASNDKAYYVYDSGGERVRKVIEKGNITEERYYLGGYEIYRRINSSTLEVERESLFIENGSKAIAQIDNDGTTQTIRYQYDNHLGSASLELDETGDIISYEEYHPFGTTSYRSGRDVTEVSLKRYKYVGKERDNETGLYYYGARYYGDWIARFVSVDPLAGKFPFYTPYQYSGDNPVTFYDMDGNERVDNTNTNVDENGQQKENGYQQTEEKKQ